MNSAEQRGKELERILHDVDAQLAKNPAMLIWLGKQLLKAR